jgi:diguanylate cyclase (GGDEF)-like protein
MSLYRSYLRPGIFVLCLLSTSVASSATHNPAASTLRPSHVSSRIPADGPSPVNCGAPPAPSELESAAAAPMTHWWQTWALSVVAIPSAGLLLWALLLSHRRRTRRATERLERAVAERNAELAKANLELQEVSLSDPLTGIRNRRFFLSMIDADASQAIRAARSATTFSADHRELLFFLVDIDHFKAVNDEFGHDAGDRVLVQIAARLSSVVRESDFLIRWGGEEFLVVCRSADRGDGTILADRILKSVNKEDFDLGNDRRLARSCSVGWAPFPCLPPVYSDLAVDEVLRLADRGLYLAKQRGRNQAIGMIPAPDVLKRTKYSRLEELLEDDLVREIPTPGNTITASDKSLIN